MGERDVEMVPTQPGVLSIKIQSKLSVITFLKLDLVESARLLPGCLLTVAVVVPYLPPRSTGEGEDTAEGEPVSQGMGQGVTDSFPRTPAEYGQLMMGREPGVLLGRRVGTEIPASCSRWLSLLTAAPRAARIWGVSWVLGSGLLGYPVAQSSSSIQCRKLSRCRDPPKVTYLVGLGRVSQAQANPRYSQRSIFSECHCHHAKYIILPGKSCSNLWKKMFSILFCRRRPPLLR